LELSAFCSLISYSSGCPLYLRFAPVPLPSGSLWATEILPGKKKTKYECENFRDFVLLQKKSIFFNKFEL
jgi:hypothetical protein